MTRLSLVLLGACYDPVYGAVAGLPASPTHADLQPYWEVHCAGSGCHTEGGSAGGLALDDGFAALVDVESTKAPGMARVAPGDPAASFLLYALRDTTEELDVALSIMPVTGALDEADVTAIETWIQEGALP